MPRFKVLVGMNYPDGAGGEKRAEPGDVVDDLPEKASKWLERDGLISRDLKAEPAPEPEEGEA